MEEKKNCENLLAIMITRSDDGWYNVTYALRNGSTGAPCRSFKSLDEVLAGVKETEHNFR